MKFKTTSKRNIIGILMCMALFQCIIWGETKPYSNVNTTISGKKVSYVKINLKNQGVKPVMMTAGYKINKAQSLKSMCEGVKAFAGINGSYFAAYNNEEPFSYGTVIKDGGVLNNGAHPCTIGFTKDNKVLCDFVKVKSSVLINEENICNIWGINKKIDAPTAVTLFNDKYAGKVYMPAESVGIVCEKGSVTRKIQKAVEVPKNGYIIVMQKKALHIAGYFNVGDRVSYQAAFETTYTKGDQWKEVTQAISAGPSLLINGKVVSDPKKEGFTEDKIVKNQGQRSFIGVTTDNQLMIGTVSGATVKDMVGIAKQLKLHNAMCLDGGASSGLYFEKGYITEPGRDINNALCFIVKKDNKVSKPITK